MSMAVRIEPTRGYVPRRPVRILPDPDYKVPNLHSRQLTGPTRTVEAEWCPVCHSGQETISERMNGSRPVWHCDICGYEW